MQLKQYKCKIHKNATHNNNYIIVTLVGMYI